jgi:hypothetical protein
MTLAKHAELAKQENVRIDNQCLEGWRPGAHLSCRERSQAPRRVRASNTFLILIFLCELGVLCEIFLTPRPQHQNALEDRWCAFAIAAT